jgi:hypothetical protein
MKGVNHMGNMKNWSVVKVLTENGERVGILEDAPKSIPTIATGLSYEESIAECTRYSTENGIETYEGDCPAIDFV